MPIEAPIRETPTVREPSFKVEWLPPHRVVVHNNDTNSFDEVIAVLLRAVPGCTLELAVGYTYEIHFTGAAVVFRGDVEEAGLCAAKIRAIGIRVTVEPDC
ncbi:MAG TPA: ATP-dependent Clp protease adaptor ClpS [Oscillatoriaceae cyanobacterium]